MLKSVNTPLGVDVDKTQDISAIPTTEVALKFNGNFDDYIGPLDGGAAVYQKAMQTNPVLYPRFYEPDAQFQNSTHILFGNPSGWDL